MSKSTEEKKMMEKVFHIAAVLTTKGEWDDQTGLLFVQATEDPLTMMSDPNIAMWEAKAAELEGKQWGVKYEQYGPEGEVTVVKKFFTSRKERAKFVGDLVEDDSHEVLILGFSEEVS